MLSKRYDRLWFDKFGETGELTSQHVTGFAQDTRGFIWIGTRSGLNRYDGYEFEEIRTNPNGEDSLKDGYVETLLADSKGNLWVGASRGVYRFDYETGAFESYLETIDGTHVFSLVETSHGEVFAAVRERIYRYLPDENRFEVASEIDVALPRVLLVDRRGRLWIGSQNGLFIWTEGTRELRRIPLGVDSEDDSGVLVTALAESENGYVLCGTLRNGAYIVDSTFVVATEIELEEPGENAVGSILVDPDGVILIGTSAGLRAKRDVEDPGVLYKYSEYDLGSVQSGKIDCLLVDSQENLWVGASRDGFSRVSAVKDFYTYRRSYGPNGVLTKDRVSALHKSSDGTLWVGYGDDGVDRVNLDTEKSQFYDPRAGLDGGLGVGGVRSIVEHPSGTIWIGTHTSGLQRMDAQTGEVVRYAHQEGDDLTIGGNNVHGLLLGEDNELWMGVDSVGIDRLNTVTGEITQIRYRDGEWFERKPGEPFDRSWVNDMVFDQSDGVWIGTSRGLVRLSLSNMRFEAFEKTVLGVARVMCLYLDSRGDLWIGGHYGVYRRDGDSGEIENFDESSGLGSNEVRSIIEDDSGRIWIGTSRGLSVFDESKDSFLTYGRADGLFSHEFLGRSVIRDESGMLYFGTTKGICYFDPEEIVPNPIAPKTYITGFRLFGRTVADTYASNEILNKPMLVTDSITLPPGYGSFGFDFVGMNLIGTERNRYAYRLQGFDSDWVFNDTKRQASYTNIGPGDYVFEVKAANNDGLWSHSPTQVAITVLPHFWQTSWFYGLCVVLFLGLIVSVYRIRVSVLRKRERLLSKLVEEKTSHLKDALKEVEDHRKNLEQKIEQRTIELRAEKDKAEKSEIFKTAFLENVAHDIRTPASAIIGFLNLLNLGSELSEDEKVQFNGLIKKNSESLLVLVNDILDLSKMESGTMTLNKEVGDLTELFDGLLVQFQEELKRQSKAEIELKLLSGENRGALYLKMDAPRLRQVIGNLIENAIKFTEEGTVEFGYELEQGIGNQAVVKIQVRDTGIGMSEAEIDMIFERYGRLEKDAVKHYHGTGLGLAIVKKLTELMGGSIEVESEPEKGSCFTIVLPFEA